MSDVAELEALKARVEGLERRIARGRALAVGALVLVAGACAAAAMHSDVDEVRARRFVVVDEQGEVRGTFSSDPGLFDVGITMRSADGLASALFGVRSALEDSNGSREPYAVVTLDAEASAGESSSDVNLVAGAGHAHVGASSDDSGASLFATRQEARIIAERHVAESQFGAPRIDVRADASSASVTSVGADGRPLAKLP